MEWWAGTLEDKSLEIHEVNKPLLERVSTFLGTAGTLEVRNRG